MKNRGLTLIELIATLVVLSVIATIVIPNIYDSINDYKTGLYEMQLKSIIGASKNWSADNYKKLSVEEGGETYVYLKELQEDGYIDNPLKNNKDGKEFNGNTFVLIKCNVIKSDKNNEENYNYSYEVYDTNEKYIILLSKKYLISKNITSDTTIKMADLISYAEDNLKVNNKLKNIEDGTLISSVIVYATYKNNEFEFQVTID